MRSHSSVSLVGFLSIEELKWDLAADDFCWQEFYAPEAAFLAILMLFNLRYPDRDYLGAQTFRVGMLKVCSNSASHPPEPDLAATVSL